MDELWIWPAAVVAIVAGAASQIALTGWLLLVFLAWIGLHLNRITYSYSLWAIKTELRRLRKRRRRKVDPDLDLDDDLP